MTFVQKRCPLVGMPAQGEAKRTAPDGSTFRSFAVNPFVLRHFMEKASGASVRFDGKESPNSWRAEAISDSSYV
jgi:hypothetical protein